MKKKNLKQYNLQPAVVVDVFVVVMSCVEYCWMEPFHAKFYRHAHTHTRLPSYAYMQQIDRHIHLL